MMLLIVFSALDDSFAVALAHCPCAMRFDASSGVECIASNEWLLCVCCKVVVEVPHDGSFRFARGPGGFDEARIGHSCSVFRKTAPLPA